MDVSARFAGAIVSFLLVAVILLQTSVTLGLVVLIGVPVLMLLIGPLLRPLQRRSGHQRQLMGELSNTATDIVGGLRVLRGIGGEQVFHDRYRRESQTTRQAGVEVARLQSVLDALQVFLPGVFVVLVVWLGARSAVAGRDHAGRAGRVLRLLGVPDDPAAHRHRVRQQADPRPGSRRAGSAGCSRSSPTDPTRSSPVDAATAGRGAGRRPHRAADPARRCSPRSSATQPDEAGRAGRPAGPHARPSSTTTSRWAASRSPALRRDDVRRRIVVSDTGADAVLRAGWRDRALDSRRGAPPTVGYARRRAALDTASADDILEALPDGLDTVVAERGRTFSGGQRQRLVLARALAGDPEILVLVEPTSAVDAHTEARIAARLRAHRAGRTTVVITTSPLMLDAVDEVAFLHGGRVVATGTHAELLETDADYRAVVTREAERTARSVYA